MRLKYLKFIILIIIFLQSYLFGQQDDQKSDITQYRNSFEQYQNLTYQQLKIDIENKIKRALELKQINMKIALQRLLEIIYLYPEYFKEVKNQDFILNEIFNIYKNEKSIKDFEQFLHSLKELNLIDQNVEDKYKDKYKSFLN